MAKRAPTHSQQEWNTVKPHFVELYVRQKKKLKDAAKILEARGFFASERQYKTKIREWKLGKYHREQELLHVARKFTKAKCSGKNVDIKIRQRSVTMDDVMKHFDRKSVFDEVDLFKKLPTSPTPSIISCRTIADTETRVQIPQSTTSTTERDSPRPVMLPKRISTPELEIALLALRRLAQANVTTMGSRPAYTWQPPCDIVENLIRTQSHLNADRIAEARMVYGEALDSITQSMSWSCASVLQLILHIFTARLYENTTTLSTAFLRYLAQQDPSSINTTLVVVAKALDVFNSSELWSWVTCQRAVCDIFESRLGPESALSFWSKAQLCRYMFLAGQSEAAWGFLESIEITRASTGQSLEPLLRHEVDREIGGMLCLFGDPQAARWYLEPVLNHYLSQGEQSRDQHGNVLQQLAACNSQLGLYDLAYAQARQAAKIFETAYGKHHVHTNLSFFLLNRIENLLSLSNGFVAQLNAKTRPRFYGHQYGQISCQFSGRILSLSLPEL